MGAMGRSSRYFILGLCIVRLFLPLAYAQKTSGTIRGVITDPSGAVVTNATVVVRNDGTGSTRAVNTNGQGEYVALELPSGTYVINVQAPGFKEAASLPITLHVSSTEVQNVQVQMGSVSEQVTANATRCRHKLTARHSAKWSMPGRSRNCLSTGAASSH
jgi:hypothetical protein